MKLTISQEEQVRRFTFREKVEALQHCRFPVKLFTNAAGFVSSMKKMMEEGREKEASPRQQRYLDLLFWKYRKQHRRVAEAERQAERTAAIPMLQPGTESTQPDLFTKPRTERVHNKYY